MTKEKFITTATYPNRVLDKEKLEKDSDLIEPGSSNFYFYTPDKILIAKGYIRVVYGDHSPYLEFLKDQICWDNLECKRKDVGYYNKWYPKNNNKILIYEQRKTVKSLKNPPSDGRGFKGNRAEGYADYRIGRVYIDPYQLKISHTEIK